MKLTFIVSLLILLASCALVEPTASRKFNTVPGTSTEKLFSCTEAAISSLKKENTQWQLNVTSRNLQSGLFETNNFKEANVLGIRAQIKYDEVSSKGSIKVKASGPYFVDLGADHAAKALESAITQCAAPN